MNYKDEIVKAMAMLARDERVLFIGQSVRFSGHIMFNTLEEAKVPMSRRIELPVLEDSQLGFCIGLALEGFLPVSIYPRFDFLIIAMNQLVNHLDKMKEMSNRQFNPKVLIRTMVGSKKPLNPGPQHYQDYTEPLRDILTNIDVVKLVNADSVLPSYIDALKADNSTILVEIGDLY